MAQSSRDGFHIMVNRNGLIDLGFDGNPYTWNNKRIGRANICERLDKGFANGQWRILFPNASVSHLLAFNSDHRPILLTTNPHPYSRPKPFRFEAMWVRDPTTAVVIENAWNKGNSPLCLPSLMGKIKTTKVALKAWNCKVYGNIHSSIKTIKDRMEILQSLPQTLLYDDLENKAQVELDELLLRERLLWKGK